MMLCAQVEICFIHPFFALIECCYCFTEDGIYCELNLPGCLTYILGIGCNESTLLPLKNAITKAAARIAALPDLPTTTSLLEQQVDRQEPASLGGLAFLAEVSTYEDLEVRTLSTGPELIGKIAAETVRAPFSALSC